MVIRRASIVPGYFGEKHVKWLTRIELTDAERERFLRNPRLGPGFHRADTVENRCARITNRDSRLSELTGTNRSQRRRVRRRSRHLARRVEFDDGETWDDAEIYYSGGDLAWSLWSYRWQPDDADDYTLVVRATDGEGDVQELEEDRGPFSGVTGFHKIVVHVTA